MLAVDDTFSMVLDSLVVQNAQAARAAKNEGPAAWWVPSSGAVYDLENLESWNYLFDRSSLSYEYNRILLGRSEGEPWPTTGEAMAVRVQIEWLLLHDRAFRTRHCSHVRQLLHSAVRRSSHADPAGVLLGGLRQWVETNSAVLPSVSG